MGKNNIPDDSIINRTVAVYQGVAKSDDFGVVVD